MPSHSDLPGKISRRKIIKALKRLGFIIDKKGGKGSHLKATCIATQKCVTIPSDLSREVLYYVIKEIEKNSSVTWEDIKKNL